MLLWFSLRSSCAPFTMSPLKTYLTVPLHLRVPVRTMASNACLFLLSSFLLFLPFGREERMALPTSCRAHGKQPSCNSIQYFSLIPLFSTLGAYSCADINTSICVFCPLQVAFLHISDTAFRTREYVFVRVEKIRQCVCYGRRNDQIWSSHLNESTSQDNSEILQKKLFRGNISLYCLLFIHRLRSYDFWE